MTAIDVLEGQAETRAGKKRGVPRTGKYAGKRLSG